MTPKQSTRAPKWAATLALVLLVATTQLSAAQSPDILLPLVTDEGHAQEEAPNPPLQPDPAAPIGDSRDTNSGDYDVPAAPAAIAAFNATQWTVQNNLGLGTDAPTADIDVMRNVNTYTRLFVRNSNSGSDVQTQLYLNTGGSNGLVVQQFGSGYSAKWGPLPLTNMARLRTTPPVKGLILTTGGSFPLIFGTADQERMRITPGGQVGIGTTGPDAGYRLTVSGRRGLNGIKITGAGYGLLVDSPSQNGIEVHDAEYHGVYVDNPSLSGMIVADAGADAFAAIEPRGYGLEVVCPCGTIPFIPYPNTGVLVSDGNIRVQNGSFIDSGTTLNVPDYVFEPEYPLMSIDELRTYVTEEKHLPNVPNEAEIRAGGLNLSEFQMKLLEKTEELTLYTLAQDEQLQSQDEQLRSQQQQIESLQQDNQAKDAQLENQGEQLESLQQIVSLLQQQNSDLETRLAALEEQE